MGLRIEWFLAFIIVVITFATLMLKIETNISESKSYTKELEFTKTTFTEVDIHSMRGRIYSKYGIYDDSILYLNDVLYHTDTIAFLISKKGKYINNILYLDGDVVMQEKDGSIYKTQHANYNQKTDVLAITSSFSAKSGQNMMKGNTLLYNTRLKEAFGTKIDSIFFTAEK